MNTRQGTRHERVCQIIGKVIARVHSSLNQQKQRRPKPIMIIAASGNGSYIFSPELPDFSEDEQRIAKETHKLGFSVHLSDTFGGRYVKVYDKRTGEMVTKFNARERDIYPSEVAAWIRENYPDRKPALLSTFRVEVLADTTPSRPSHVPMGLPMPVEQQGAAPSNLPRLQDGDEQK